MPARTRVSPANLVRPEIRALSAYPVPVSEGMIKLDAMENPYGWPAELVERWLETLRCVPLNRYPDPGAVALKARLRETMAIPAQAGLILGNGSDELIQIIALALAKPGAVVLAPEPGFVMYRMIAVYAGMEYVGVPLRAADFSLDTEAMLAAIERHRPAVVFLAYPNNPTGNLFAAGDVRRLIAATPGIVVLDEAYFTFADRSFLPALEEYPNVLVMRTVSKMGLAGLRLGFLVGAPEWLDELEKLRLPYNISVMSQVSAGFALENKAVLDQQARYIRRQRGELFAQLEALPGITAFPSDANFILFRTPEGQALRVFEALKAARILIKYLGGGGGLLRECLRVTVGTPAENQAFISALQRIL